MTAIITCGQTRQSLSATRALGKAGIAVAVGSPFRPCLSMWSRFASSTFLTKDPKAHAREFAEQIGQEMAGRYASCVLTGTDEAYWALSRFREFLPVSARRVMPPHVSIARSLEPLALYDFAETLQIPCLPLINFSPHADALYVEQKLQDMLFPLVVRPSFMWKEREDGFRKVMKKKILKDSTQLQSFLKTSAISFKEGFWVSSKLSNPTISFIAFCDRGTVIASGCQERIREEESLGPVATLARTIEPIEEVTAYAQRLLLALQWQGPVKVDFVKDQAGVFCLTALVGRLWSSLQLSVFAGLNIPLLMYRQAEGTLTADLLTNMRPHVQMRWLMGDAFAVSKKILSTMTHPWQLPNMLWNLRKQLGARRPKHLRKYIDVFDPQDPMPFLFELQHATWKPVLGEGKKRLMG